MNSLINEVETNIINTQESDDEQEPEILETKVVNDAEDASENDTIQ